MPLKARRGFPSAAFLAGGAAFLGVMCGTAVMSEPCFAFLFCRVPAWIAAGFFGAGLDGSVLVLGTGRVVAVTRECGGSDFFALVCAVLTWHAVRHNDAAMLPLWWCGAWAGTLLVNGLRVIATVWTRAIAECILPERFFGAVHLVSGVLVFFPVLLLLWWGCVRHDLSGKTWIIGMKE